MQGLLHGFWGSEVSGLLVISGGRRASFAANCVTCIFCLIRFILQVPRKCIAEFSVNAQKTGTLQNADFVQARSCPEATSP